MSRPIENLQERFWSKVDKNGPIVRPELGNCWVWCGWKNKTGYGYFSINAKEIRAHRAVFIISGTLPSLDVNVLHKCDNPSCVRPDHLFFGTHKDNAVDRGNKGRTAKGDKVKQKNPVCGEKQWCAKLKQQDIVRIFNIYLGGASKASIAREFGVTRNCIRSILSRKTWRHVIPPSVMEAR